MAELEIKPSRAAQMRVLVVLAIGGAILGLFIFLLTGGGRNFFESTSTLTTYMPDVTGLSAKSQVRLSGIPIGAVRSIQMSGLLDPQRVVRVEMRVNSRFLKNIPADSQTSITADTLVGDAFVSIDEGKSPLPVADNGTLRSEPLKEAGDRADQVHALQRELQQVDDLLVQITSPDTKIGQFVHSDDYYNNVLRQITGLATAAHALVAPKSAAGQMLFSSALYDRIHEPVIQLDKMLAAMQRGEGAAGRLLTSDAQYREWVQTLTTLRAGLADANAGKGQLGPLLRDDAAYRNVQRMLAQTDALLASLNAGDSSVSQMLRSPQLYESLNGALRSLQAMLADLQQNPQKYLRYQVFNRNK